MKLGFHNLIYVCPSKRGNFMKGVHVKQDCPNFGVLGKGSVDWLGLTKTDCCNII